MSDRPKPPVFSLPMGAVAGTTLIDVATEKRLFILADDYADLEVKVARLTAERDAVCVWRSEDLGDGAVYTTGCKHRVEPAPGVQRCCHMCGKRIQIAGEVDHE